MLKLIKNLRPYAWQIAAVFVLLFASAMADLALPAYMARIVNVGIQQGGIENAVPRAMRADEFNKVTLLMSQDEKTRVMGDYILLDRQELPCLLRHLYIPNCYGIPYYLFRFQVVVRS